MVWSYDPPNFNISSTHLLFTSYFLPINMKPTHIEHIGIAVADLEESIAYYEKVLGLECYAIEEVKDQKVKTAFFKIGDTKLELLESTDPDGPIGKFIEKRGQGIHHLAFAVNRLLTFNGSAFDNPIF